MSRKSNKKSVNKDAWLTTYGDMITLVLVFFVYLFSISTIDSQKWERMVEAFQQKDNSAQIVLVDPEASDGTELPGHNGDTEGLADSEQETTAEEINDIEDLYQYFSEYVQQTNMEDSIQVGKGDGFVIMRFKGSLFFAPDKSVLLPAAQDVLTALSDGIISISDQIQLIRIDGHTATVAQSSKNNKINNRILSTERANAVLMFLENKQVVDPVKLLAVGYGRYRPIADNGTEEGREQNRRVEIYISDQDSFGVNIDQVYEALAPEGN